LRKMAQKMRPIILSTGMGDLGEVEEAVDTVRSVGNERLILLHAVTSYPARFEDVNLRAMLTLEQAFRVPVGYSDHTPGLEASLAAVAMGARVIEKHFTLSRADKGPDSEFSLEPDELKQLCQDTKIAWKSLGVVNYELKESEKSGHKFRRSLYAVQDIKKGEEITKDNVKSIRPGLGLKPKYYEQILGKVAKFDLEYGTPISFDAILYNE